jgi:predicted nucleotidyltransferase
LITKGQILNSLQQALPTLPKKYGLSSIALFASYSRNDHTAESDVNLIVDFDKPVGIEFLDLADELECILNAKVHLITKITLRGNPKKFDLIENDSIYI